MSAQKVATENKKIFLDCVRYALMEDMFHSVLAESFTRPVHYGLGTASGSYGILHVHTNVRGECENEVDDRNKRREFFRAMSDFDLLGRVATLLGGAIGGDLNAEATIIENGYCFQFRITKYIDPSRGHKFIENPLSATFCEKLLRVVELTITRVH